MSFYATLLNLGGLRDAYAFMNDPLGMPRGERRRLDQSRKPMLRRACESTSNVHYQVVQHFRGSNKSTNVAPPDTQTSYWIWRVDPAFRAKERERGYFNPLWDAFSILTGGLLLNLLISVTLGISALPVNIIIGVIVVLGLGMPLRLALAFFQEWNV